MVARWRERTAQPKLSYDYAHRLNDEPPPTGQRGRGPLTQPAVSPSECARFVIASMSGKRDALTTGRPLASWKWCGGNATPRDTHPALGAHALIVPV